MQGPAWEEWELEFLHKNAGTMNCAAMANHLPRTMGAIYKKASSLGVKLVRLSAASRVSMDDKKLCIALRKSGLSYKEIANKMDMACTTVWGICNPHAECKSWSTREEAELVRALRDEGLIYKVIAEKMEISITTAWKMCSFKGRYVNDRPQQG